MAAMQICNRPTGLKPFRSTMGERERALQTDAFVQERPDFRSAVILIDNSLHDDDLASMKFLCQGLVVGSKLNHVEAAHELIGHLENAKLVTDRDFFLLADLLQYIQRIDVLESIGYEETEVMYSRHIQGSKVNAFYVLLFQIAEELPDEDVKKASYMYGRVPRSKKLSSGLDLFTIMVQHQAIGPGKVDPLRSIFHSIERQDIIELISRYTASQGKSVMEDLEESFRRAMDLRGIHITPDMRRHPQPQDAPGVPLNGQMRSGGHNSGEGRRGGGSGSGLGPCRDDIDISNTKRGTPFSSSSCSSIPTTPSDVFSTMNNPPSGSPLNPSAPPPSLPSLNNYPHPDPSVSAPPVSVPVAPHRPAAESPAPEGFDNYVIPWPVLDMLASNIPAEYWQALSSSLGAPVTSDWSNAAMNRNHQLAVLKRWLDLPETQQTDPVSVKVYLVKALAFSGPCLMAEEIARKLNIDFQAVMRESMSTQQGSAMAVDENDVASTGSAVPESMAINQPVSLGNIPVDPRLRHMSLQPSPIPFYRMDRLPRGMCLIINNRDFYKDPRKMEAKEMVSREGTDVDRDKLQATFEQLNFHVMLRDNCTDFDMIQLVQYAANQDHQDFDCFVCCILTHGIQGALYGVNGMTVPIRDLTAPFRAQACPSLADKPKLFFLQACQGREKQGGQVSDMQVDCLQADGPPELIPNESDFLLGYATVPGFVSYRSKTRGSWYITKLTDLLNKYAFDHDVLDILTLVNYEVGKGDALIDGGQYKQSPAPMYSLRKKLIFARPF